LCGIVGYNGFRDADKVLIDSLKKLEYRGYDSSGIAIIDKKQQVFKEIGEIKNLEEKIPKIKGHIGMGHTRWATHGEVSKKNAHPHLSNSGKIAIVHNGIIENYVKLRENLEKKGFKFTSQTDSEVIANLIEDNYKDDLKDAVFSAIKKLKGYYALVISSKDEPDKIIGARLYSPLVIGVGDNENFLASDIPAILKYTNRAVYLDDGEVCVLKKNKVEVFDSKKKSVDKEENVIKWDLKDAEKSGFSHFMLKEIYDQPDAINQVLQGRISEINRSINFDESVEDILDKDIDSINIVACGTSYYAGLVGKYLIENLVKIPVFVDLASEYRYYGTKQESSLVIAITQSGETLDTLAAIREAKNSGCRTLTITNVIGSTATRISDSHILMQCGPEIGVAATKTFSSQILILLLIALKMGLIKDKIGADEIYKYIAHLRSLPRVVRDVLDKKSDIDEVSKQLKNADNVFFIGRGINYPISLEGALKLKEISYIHAEGFAAGELKHGPFALLTKITPVVAIVTKDDTYDKMIANIGEVKARGPQVIAIAEEDDTVIEKHADFVLRIPKDSEMFSFIPIVVTFQLLAYSVANLRKCPIDKPRNLAKSVTVE